MSIDDDRWAPPADGGGEAGPSAKASPLSHTAVPRAGGSVSASREAGPSASTPAAAATKLSAPTRKRARLRAAARTRGGRVVGAGEDGRAPTLAELKAFYSDGKASWTSGTAQVDGDTCTTVTFTPTADYPPRSVEGVEQLSVNFSVYCLFSPTQLRAATDGSAVFVRAKSWERDRIVVLDMVNNAHHAVTLTDTEDLIWAFDDLLIVTSKTGTTALTPSASGA